TQWVLEGVSATHRPIVKAVYMLVCRKDNKKGTAFATQEGLIVTASHVVATCGAGELEATSSMGKRVNFTAMVRDEKLDIAVLHPRERPLGGLKLASDIQPTLHTQVATWGFPLTYNGPAPLLSVGYVAGFAENRLDPGHPVKRLIVNGAFNPGNSGGPLVDEKTGRVVGIVVEKWTLYSQLAEVAIKGLSHPKARSGGTFSYINGNGQTIGVSNEEMIGMVLAEFYAQAQVTIGEAISISELKLFMKRNSVEIASWASEDKIAN